MDFSTLEEALGTLKTCYLNLKKSPNRKRKLEGANKKLKEILQLWNIFIEHFTNFNQKNLTEQEHKYLTQLTSKAKEYRELAEAIVKNNIQENNSEEPGSDQENQEIKSVPETQEKVPLSSLNKMAEFDFSKAQKLPVLTCEENNKRTENIRDFLNNIEFYHDTLKKDSQTMLIKFLLKCKIQGRALTELGAAKIETFEQLKTNLVSKCGDKDTIESIQSKLDRSRQRNRPMREFVSEIEQLISKMTELEIGMQGEEARETLTIANEHRGLAFLKQGVNDRYRIILDSARHT